MALKFLNDGYFAGKVGIGTESPYNKTHITTSVDGDGLLLDYAGSNNKYVGVFFKIDTNTSDAYKKGALVWERTGSYNEGRFHFLLNNDDNASNVDLTDSKVTILSTGNVGIGTTASQTILHLKSGGSPSLRIQDSDGTDQYATINHNNGSNQYIARNNTSNGQHIWYGQTATSSFNERMRIDSSGNVGIGTTSPNAKLQVNDNVRIGNTSTGVRFYIQGVDEFRADALDVAGNGWNSLHLRADGTDGLFLQKDTNNVGIGTTSPSTKLDVDGVTTSLGFRTDTTNTNWSLISRDSAGNSPLYVQSANSDTDQWIARFNYGSAIANGGDNVLTVAKDNSYFLNTNVGIGTTSPSSKLNISSASYNDHITLTRSSDELGISVSGGQLMFEGGVSPFNNNDKDLGRSDKHWREAFVYSLRSGGALQFKTNGNNERMRIDSSGNVGIGTTGPLDKLHVNGRVRTSTDGVVVGDTNAVIYRNSNDLELITYGGFDINLMPAGNVGVGTASPSQKLHVAGNARVTGAYYDSNNSPGTANQVLVSTATGTDWIDGSAIPGVPAGSGTLNTIPLWTPDGNTLGNSPITVSSNDSTFGGSITAPDFRGTAQVYLTSPDSWLFRSTGGSERMRLSSAGNLGINTTNPVYKLDVNGDARSTHFRDGAKGTGTTSTTAGWYKVASWTGGAKRGGSEIKLSTTGGSFTPITWIIRCFKNWSNDATLKLEHYGYANIWFTKARIVRDTTTDILYVEIYQPGTTAVSFDMYQTSLMGYDSNVTMVTGTLAAGTPTADASVRTELPFTTGGTSVEALTIGDSGNTGPYLPLAGGTMTGNTDHNDNVFSRYGTADQLRIWNNGSNSYIFNYTSGNINIGNDAADKDVVFYADRGDGLEDVFFRLDGSETNGTTVLGVTLFPDKSQVRFGNQGDLRIYHDGSNSYIDNTTNDLYIRSTSDDVIIQSADDVFIYTQGGEDAIIARGDGVVELYYDNTKKLSTGSVSVGTATTIGGTLIDGWKTTTQANAINDTTIATTAYVNNKIQLIPAGLVFQGTWDARTAAEGGAAGNKGNPALTSGVGTTGNFYIVSNAGSVNLDGITDWKVGDWAVFIEQGASDQWEKIDNSSVLDGFGTGQSVTKWNGSGTSNTLTDGPITFSSNDSTFAGTISSGAITSTANISGVNLIASTAVYSGGIFYGSSTLSLKKSNGNSYVDFDTNLNATFAGDVTTGPNITATGNTGNSTLTLQANTGNWTFTNVQASRNLEISDSDGTGTVMTINTSGNVGIGRSSSITARLFVEGPVDTATISTSSTPAARINNGGAISNWIGSNGYNYGYIQSIQDDGSNNLKPLSLQPLGGNVGIGTTSPGYPLDIVGFANSSSGFRVTDGTIDNRISWSSGNVGFFGTISNHPIAFNTNSIERMRITSAGNVGIGTTNPLSKLTIDAPVGNFANGTNAISLNYDGGSSPDDVGGGIVFSQKWWSGSAGLQVTGGIYGIKNAGDGTYGGGLAFYTQPSSAAAMAQRMIIDTDGNVGIGTASPTRKLSVENSSSSIVADFKYSAAGYSSIDLSNNVSFARLSSVNSDLLLSPAGLEKMRITSAGNVGIGTTTPTAKLHVVGTGLFTGLVSGITPVAAANFVTKAYVDGSGGGTGPFLPLAGGTLTGNVVVDGAQIFIDTDTAGNSLTWRESDSSIVAGQLRGYGNRGDIYLYDSGVKKTELSSQADSFIPALHIGGTSAATGGVLQVTGNATFAGDVIIDDGVGRLTLNSVSGANKILSTTTGFGTYELLELRAEAYEFKIGTTEKFSINGSGNATFAGDVIVSGGDLTINSTGNAILNVNGTANSFVEKDTGTDLYFANNVSDKDIIFRVKDGTTNVIALTLDGSEGGNATFAGTVTAPTFLGDLNGTINTVTTAVTKANSTNDTTVATTAFVQNLIETIPAGLVFQGTWNAATNTPTLTSGSGTTGNFYIVSVAGSTNLDGITDWKVGDWAVFIEQGQNDQWEKIDNSSVLDGIGTGQTVPLWAGSGTSNTLDNSIITQTGSSPSQQIRITSENDAQLRFGDGGTTLYAGIHWFDVSGNDYMWFNGSSGTFAIGGGGSGVSGKKLHIDGSTSIGSNYDAASPPTNGLVVEGNVGIGTTSPGYKLTVNGDVDVNNGAILAAQAYGINLGVSGYDIVMPTTTRIAIKTSGSERVSILNTGNVGIGVTGPTTHLEVVASQSNSSIKAGGLEMQSYAVNNSWYAENLYYDGGWKLRSNGYATQMYMQESKITFNRFVSGNAGDFVTPYQTMILDSNGKVGISTTNPSAQLQVTSAGGNGSAGYTDYGILTTAGGSSQATIGVMHDGDGYASLNLGSNVSGSNVFWHISKRTAVSTDFGGNNGLDYWYYNGSGFTNAFGFSTAGNFKAAGSIQMADDTDTASATKVGTMRYRTATNEPVPVTGTDLVTNGDLAVSTGWNLQNSASINNTTGVATVPGAGSLTSTGGNWSLYQSNVMDPNKTYMLRFQARRDAGPNANMYAGWAYTNQFNQTVTADWVQYEVVFTTTSQTWDELTFGGVTGTTFEVKDIVVIEVTEENASYADMCMQTGASTYEWVNIVRNTY